MRRRKSERRRKPLPVDTLLELVPCLTCKALHRDITLCTRDSDGTLRFIGRLLPAMRVDVRHRKIYVPCRVCKLESVFDIP